MHDAPPLVPGHPYAAFLDKVLKPARYAGGEVGSVVKEWTPDIAKVCLAFPDVYDIGMSHLGFKILYKILNDDPRTLAERCYAPWVDMEAELRARGLPLVSLESARPLKDFDVVGFSLQFELTYTNILNMLALGGVPLRSADRGEDDPLVIAGGPVATHPEPISAFIDALVIGDGESKATEIALAWTSMKKDGIPRNERLARLAALGAVYVPSLYETKRDDDTGFHVVDKRKDTRAPRVVSRALVDLKDYPFPDSGPTGGPEAIFDRMSIEIARGCTEGCRFCQAGMIYRPVRERDPEEIVDTVVRAVKNSGQDEVSLTALSTADVSCISPLLKKVARKLAEERISLGVSSLRAYGLEPDLLDELKAVRATGLTFAPEAGSQRMRDVVNKNVTEEQLLETAERVFSRGFGKMKLYFMIGLPTEQDDDVRGIVETGVRAYQVGKRAAKGKGANVTVSVSTHVPKPHTPFQWCAMDALDEVSRKQKLMRDAVRPYRAVTLKTHDADASVLEGVFARGDRTLCDVLETAWKNGARFDSWDEHLKLDVWAEALRAHGVDPATFLGTIPVNARLPWDHIDVGLEDGFLAKEYRKALQNRLSPPCGKVAGAFVHHTNLEDANADHRKLVCYDCGVACDMTMMRNERLDYLEKLGAKKRLPVVQEAPVEAILEEEPSDETPKPKGKPSTPRLSRGSRVRFGFEKTGPAALLGHLDLVRELPRILRRLEIGMAYTQGFHPKPDMMFAPALALGVLSLDEYVDIILDRHFTDEEVIAMPSFMNAASPRGLTFTSAEKLDVSAPSISKAVVGASYLLVFAKSTLRDFGLDEPALEARCDALMAATEIPVERDAQGIKKRFDARPLIVKLRIAGAESQEALEHAGLIGDFVAVRADVAIPGSGGVKPSELAALLANDVPHRALRRRMRLSVERVSDTREGLSPT